MKTAVIYARYSCDNQTEQSIEGQLRVCRDYAERNNILIIDTYVDRAMTGTNDLRPDFQRMMKDSSKKQWNYVLVYKLDRFSRDKYETTIHKHTLKMNGVKVLSAMENIPDSPEGIILESLLEGMNQYYSAELSQKVKRGMYETRRKGHYQGGWLPYGYRIEGRNIVADEEQAEVVRYMFEQYSMGTYVSTIISNLTARGILNKGKPFVPNTVYNILKNEKYSGVYRRGEEVIDNMYPQIVPQQLFDAVRQKVTENRFGKRSVKVVYLFRDKMICGYCGSPVSAETGTARGGDIVRYYKCHGKKRYHNGCELKMIRKDVLEECIVDKIIQELSHPHNMDTLVADLLREQDRQCVENSRLSSLRREKATVDRSLENLISALEQGIMSASTNKRLHELEKQQAELERNIALEESKTTVKIPENVIREFYADALKQEADLLVNLLIRQIVLYNDRIEIYLHTPTKIGPDNHRGHSFFIGQANLPFTAYHRKPSDIESVQIEIFV
jgi:DNA invertase Pin-like site-specific DNA recombinase